MKSDLSNENKLFEIINNKIFTFEFISGIAGDKSMTPEEKELYDSLLKETGGDLYVKLLFYICHKVFDIREAKTLWNEIIEHKANLCRVLGRNVEITVATLDYLTNIRSEIQHPKLIGESFIGKIAEMTSVDLLTKLYNRQYLFIKIEEEISRFKRYRTIFSLLLIDIDDFKRINDRYGHQKGDEVLVRLSNLINLSLRDLDVCARFGGEEFMVLLPHTRVHLAKEIAGRIRESIETSFSDQLKVTVSIGISTYSGTMTKTELIKNADDALYISKHEGKNRVTVFSRKQPAL